MAEITKLFNSKEQLIRLKSLTIEIYEREIWSSCIDFLKYHPIEYLSLRCIPNQVLIEAILSSPKLCKCRLYFWRSISNITECLNINSNIEILYVKFKDNSNQLIMNILLSHIPKLKRLEIENDHVNYYLDSFFTFSKLRKIKLFWLRRSMRSDYFERLLAITPIIKYIYLDLVKFPFIKIFIRCRELARTNNNNEKIMFDKYCRQILSIMNTQTNTYFKVKWIEEDSKMHRIQMIIHNIGLYLDFR
ncbi:unnamed protein product [Rotaria sordida]|uniref:Uncharacterized protein n=1 Tax=Rotaria sordida TaxID=392033 RepID=A0A818NY57_9BILA|nr:unnamed protein product [Rotaria sordida]CAF3613520.1 unnamed protein product [Rotaria sordida]